jgi:hypothetical protein
MANIYVDLISGNDSAVAKTITGASNANPCTITSTTHGLTNGMIVYINGVGGMTELNGKFFTVTNPLTNTFDLLGVDSTSYTTYTTGGTAIQPYATHKKAGAVASTGDEIRVAKTLAPTTLVSNCIFTDGSVTVQSSVDLTASLDVGSYIGKPTASGNGNFETFYRINAITSSTITLEQKYYGTSETVASILKLSYATDSGVDTASSTIYASSKNLTISGGWNISGGTPTQDGETWFKGSPASRTTAWYVYNGVGTTNLTISKINIVETNVGFSGTTTACSINSCTFSCYATPIYATNTTSFPGVVNNCAFTIGNYMLRYAISTTILSNILILATRNVSSTFYMDVGSQLNLTTNVIIHGSTSSYGIYMTQDTKLIATGLVVRYCNIGIYIGSINTFIDGGSFQYCTYGIQIASIYGSNANNITTQSCNYGVYASQCFFTNISNMTSISDSYGVYVTNDYCRNVKVFNSNFTTPTNYAIYCQTDGVDTVFILNSTIDLVSNNKAINVPTGGTNRYTPRYIVEGCTNFASGDGQYWNHFKILKSDSAYRISPPCYQFTANTTQTYQYTSVKFFSTYAVSGTQYTVGMWLKGNAGWSGTIVPLLKLNGSTVLTGTTISSLTTGWVQYTYTVPASSITANGELSLELIPNTNTTTWYVDDFTVTTP